MINEKYQHYKNNLQSMQTPRVQSLLKQLLRLWENKKINQQYQNAYLSIIDSIPQQKIQQQISKQIRLTYQHKSYYFKIYKPLKISESALYKLANIFQRLSIKKHIQQNDIIPISQLIQLVRNHNVQVAQQTLNILKQLQSKRFVNNSYKYVFNFVFLKIDKNNDILKKSIIKDYLLFTNIYDPFFLYHFQKVKKGTEKVTKYSPSIDKLFQLTLPVALKMIKIQEDILNILNEKQKYYINSSLKSQSQSKVQKDIIKDMFRIKTQKNQFVQYSGRVKSVNKGQIWLPRSKTNQQQTIIGIGRMRQRANTLHQVQPSSPINNKLPKINGSQKYNNQLYTIEPNNQSIMNSKRLLFKIKRPRLKSFSNQEQIRTSLMRRRDNNSLKRFEPQQIISNNESPLKQFIERLKISKKQQDRVLQSRNIFDLKGQKQQNQFMFLDKPVSQSQYIMHENTKKQIKKQQKYKNLSQNKSYQMHQIKEQKRNFKIKAGNLNINNIFMFLKQLNIRQQYRLYFQRLNWQNSLINNQYYLHKFYVNDQLSAVSLCLALQNANIMIKYWGPLTNCDLQLNHIQKDSIAQIIMYNGIDIPEIIVNGFIKQKQRIFKRVRQNPISIDTFNYSPFLSLLFCNVSIPKDTIQYQRQKLIVKSNYFSQMDDRQFVCFNYLLILNRASTNNDRICMFFPNLKYVFQVNNQLFKQNITSTPFNPQSKVTNLNLFTLNMKNLLNLPYFVANKSLIKLTGVKIYEDQQSLLVCVQLSSNNSKMYFGKGFLSIQSMMTVVKNRPQDLSHISFCVRMFSKRLRGQINTINLRQQLCYGSFQVIFQWKDFLKGRIQHDLSDYDCFGETSFYCLLQIDNDSILAFQINKSNLI